MGEESADLSKYINARLPNEGSKAFEAYINWINQGFSRTLAQTSRDLKKSYQLIQRWYKKYQWHERGILYDNYMQQKETEAKVEYIKQMYARHEQLAKDLQTLGSENLKRIIKILEMDPNLITLKPMELMNILKTGIDLERSIYLDETQKEEAQAQLQIIYKIVTEKNPYGHLIKGDENSSEPSSSE